MKEQKVSRKRKTVHREVTPKLTPRHACKGCDAPFPFLDALAAQYRIDWSGTGILCGACQKPVNINVKVEIDTKPFEDVMKKISQQLAEFTSVIDEVGVDVGDIQIKETPKPKLVDDSFKVHLNVRTVAEPMQFAKVKESRLKKFFKKFRGGHDGNSSKRPVGERTTQDSFGNTGCIKTNW